MVQNGKFSMEGEIYTSIDVNHQNKKAYLNTDIFAGAYDHPVVTQELDIEVLIAEFIQDNIVPNGTATPKIRNELSEKLYVLQDIIQNAINYVGTIPEWTPPQAQPAKVVKKTKVKNKKKKSKKD